MFDAMMIGMAMVSISSWSWQEFWLIDEWLIGICLLELHAVHGMLLLHQLLLLNIQLLLHNIQFHA